MGIKCRILVEETTYKLVIMIEMEWALELIKKVTKEELVVLAG